MTLHAEIPNTLRAGVRVRYTATNLIGTAIAPNLRRNPDTGEYHEDPFSFLVLWDTYPEANVVSLGHLSLL